MKEQTFFIIITAILLYGAVQAAELVPSQEQQTRRIRISALENSSFMKISEHIYHNKMDPVLWSGEVSLMFSSQVDFPVSIYLKRISLYRLAGQGGEYMGSVFINPVDWARLNSILYINDVAENRLKFTFSDGTDSSIDLKNCKV